MYEHYTSDDQIAAGGGAGSLAPGAGVPAPLLVQVLPPGLHPAPAVRPAGAQNLLPDRLPRRHANARRLRRAAPRPRPGRDPALLHPVLRRRPAPQKKGFATLLVGAALRAADRGLIPPKPAAAVDATGRESRHTSRYFFKRAGRRHSGRLWTKLTVVCDTNSHLLVGATVSRGPANDAPQFRPALAQASRAARDDRVLADAAFDSEESHRYCREDLGIRSTVIPLNRRPPAAAAGGGGPRRATGGRWSGASAAGRGAAGTGACTGSAGRRRAPSHGTSVCSARRCGPSRRRRASASVTSGYSPTTS